MALNPDVVGRTSAPVEVSWDHRDALLYAVGIGAGHEELAFTTENTAGLDQLVFPTFPVVVGWDPDALMGDAGTFDPTQLVHGKQTVTLHGPLPASGTVALVRSVTGMWDKGSAAVIDLETAATLDGQPLFTTSSSLFIRGAGGWGGERGPSGPRNEPPAREPDHVLSYPTGRDQAFLYRLTGDRNPLHTDPAFAAQAGFDTPILHGLCTYGFTGRALLHALCASDPTRFQHIEGRFASPVFPGETLTVRAWDDPDGSTVFTTSAGVGETERLVIDQGLLRHT